MNDHEKSAVDDDRKQITDYMKRHHLEEALNEIINELVKERPEDPFLDLSQSIEAR